MKPNEKNVYRIKSLGARDDALNYDISGVSLLWHDCKVSYHQTDNYLELRAETAEQFELPVCLKIEID